MVRESSQAPQARVTQIQVRVDCNGCVQKIKKALNGIHGIHDLRVDFDRQRLTIIGWADPEKVVKAIKKKTKKNVTICSNIELASSSKPTQPEQKRNATAPPFATTQPTPPEEATPTEPPSPQAGPSSEPPSTTQHNARQQWQNNLGRAKHVGQVHMTQHPHHQANRFSYGNSYIDHSDRSYHDSPVFQQEPSQSMYVTHHSYNTYMPSSSYVTEYECVRSPSWHTHYNHMEQHYSGGDHQNGNINIAAMFSDDNPNSCSIA